MAEILFVRINDLNLKEMMLRSRRETCGLIIWYSGGWRV
jgi:hypothetical protein